MKPIEPIIGMVKLGNGGYSVLLRGNAIGHVEYTGTQWLMVAYKHGYAMRLWDNETATGSDPMALVSKLVTRAAEMNAAVYR